MKPFDFNIHLPSNNKVLIMGELNRSTIGMLKTFSRHRKEFKKYIFFRIVDINVIAYSSF